MHERLLTWLRCPHCRGSFEVVASESAVAQDGDVSTALLVCGEKHAFPVVDGIPRVYAGALARYELILHELPVIRDTQVVLQAVRGRLAPDRVQESFDYEWSNYEVGDPTWGMQLQDRVRGFFLQPIRMDRSRLGDKVLLDAGCGNGTQSVAYTEYVGDVIAIDLSAGLERGQEFRHHWPTARPDRVHFVQADLQHPPLEEGSIDIIHSAGVLHHTPDTHETFLRLVTLLRRGGTFYVWLYKYEKFVTPLVNLLRKVTTRITPRSFSLVARTMALPFILFTLAVNGLGLRSYPRLTYREATLNLMDIFGVPYAHYHSYAEVAEWFRASGFSEVWPCNDSRRGFGACGRLPD